ncbi:MAG TPA: hypothetical protein PK511_12250 [Chitinophagales bacterium]|nr:hypothetical protein [Chitinophagales bacterium]HMU69062.1 hypothetical protein [Chitinophagales bacterium]HMX03043.1 hypothetical protein [Chitinophagales bacterium]HMZ88526.1 hypothetical protein [Chitinophagales bacterium]HNA58649.1 hypothetical protein [Chitinophagales bacterium]
METLKNVILCPFCGHLSQMLWVHGHGQCAICGMTIDECCRGEQACEIEDPQKRKAKKKITPQKEEPNNETTKP